MPQFQNHLLASLTAADRAGITDELTPCVLSPHAVLQQQDEVRTTTYFPDSGLVAITRTLSDGVVVGAAMVGREGLVGSPLGVVDAKSVNQAVVQMIGVGHRIATKRLSELTAAWPGLHGVMARYLEWLVEEARLAAVCNALHRIDPRLARFLLTCADRTGSATVHLTHEFLGDMLGVQRTSVTLSLRTLAEAGLIRTQRGRVDLLDRGRLEILACACYAASDDQSQALGVPSLRGAAPP